MFETDGIPNGWKERLNNMSEGFLLNNNKCGYPQVFKKMFS